MQNARRMTRGEIQVRHDIPYVIAFLCSTEISADVAKNPRSGALTRHPAHPWSKRGPFVRIPQSALQHLLRGRGRGAKFVRGIPIVSRADESDNLPQIVGTLNDGAGGRHRPNHVFAAYAAITCFLEFVAAEGDESKQRIVI